MMIGQKIVGPAIFQARNNIVFGEKFLIAVTPLCKKQLKSQFRGNLDDEDPRPPKCFRLPCWYEN